MTHDEFLKIVQLGLGKNPVFDARPHLAKLIQTKGTRISLRYEWIKDPKFYAITYIDPEIDIGDGAEWISIWIQEPSSQKPAMP